MKPLLIFDLDGTIYQLAKVWIPSVQETFSRYGLKTLSEDVIRAKIGKRSDEMTGWYRQYVSEERMEAFLSDLRKTTLSRINMDNFLFPGAVETLDRLKEIAGAMVICSNGDSEYVNLVLAEQKIGSYFTGVYTPEHGHPDKGKRIAWIMERHPQRPVMMIGDRAVDIDAGQTNGLPAIGAMYGYASEGEIDHSEILIHSISELPSAVLSILEKKEQAK